MKIGLLIRTIRHLKLRQMWYQVWRRIQRTIEPHPKCGDAELPEFTFLNVTARPKGWNDESLELLWRYNLHYFAWIDSCVEDVEHGELLERWTRENPRGSVPGWDPYPTSLRIVNWVKWLRSYGGVGGATKDAKRRVERSLMEQVDWLVRHLEYHLLANHLLANAKALVFAGKYFDRKDWYFKGLSIYRRQLPEQTCSDGVNFERSPMYHAIIFEDMLDLAEYTGEELFAAYVVHMAGGMRLLTGPDGKIALFNDATEGIAKQPAELLARAEKFGREGHAEHVEKGERSGFLRMEAGEWVLLAKSGEIGPSYQPGHAHADTFSFELWKKGRKIIGDTGCSTYLVGAVRSHERSTRAHNTVVIDGRNSSEVWASHRVGRRFDRRRHRRDFRLTEEGLCGTDHIFLKGRHDVEIRFHLPPGVSKEDVMIECPGTLSWEKCDFAEGWNIRKSGLCAVYTCQLASPAEIEWKIR